MTRKIIIDTDPGVDDAMAIYLALRSPELELVGLTTIFGNSNVEATTRNTLNLLHVAGRTDIPVARGAGRPLVLPPGPTGEWVHGDDAMGNIGWTTVLDPALKPIDIPAARFIVDTIMANPGEITLVPIGPLTNLALALQIEPRIATHVREIVMMGGSALAPGNVSPLAEANVHNDPHAASVVFSADWPITMAGLDVTESTPMNDDDFAALAASSDPLAHFIVKVVGFYQAFHRDWYKMQHGAIHTHDSCAILYLLDPTLFSGERWPITVPHDGPAKGATLVDRRGHFYKTPPVHCLLKVDAPRLIGTYLERMGVSR
ncbi:MAG TPA: nucleoside hydrolase [Thermoflexales bacterium]|nr:nucleoside hydrolase [Thermoflexales bacterium]